MTHRSRFQDLETAVPRGPSTLLFGDYTTDKNWQDGLSLVTCLNRSSPATTSSNSAPLKLSHNPQSDGDASRAKRLFAQTLNQRVLTPWHRYNKAATHHIHMCIQQDLSLETDAITCNFYLSYPSYGSRKILYLIRHHLSHAAVKRRRHLYPETIHNISQTASLLGLPSRSAKNHRTVSPYL